MDLVWVPLPGCINEFLVLSVCESRGIVTCKANCEFLCKFSRVCKTESVLVFMLVVTELRGKHQVFVEQDISAVGYILFDYYMIEYILSVCLPQIVLDLNL